MRDVRPSNAATAHLDARSTVPASRLAKKRQLKKVRVVATILGVALLAFAAWFGVRYFAYEGIDTSRYQAVYLDNENVYFGKVHYMANGDLLLQDVFRVQAAESTESGATAADVRLIKPGNELHAPDDTMRITRSKVVFIENLKTDGKVTQAITDYLKDKSAK
ncbi:hypothetical protein B7Z17_00155 [Candidatus Saccharibacteria bacterium 32-49-10]|nr:MAG: hypothetical protein B7Z17_00155 [Candidatus Saccharibacteria bacterium 32-49-10]